MMDNLGYRQNGRQKMLEVFSRFWMLTKLCFLESVYLYASTIKVCNEHLFLITNVL
uniref:Uncharacterized protein n=1 Tax=Setaria italica TaxID=4555 RepID=K3ZGB9_SETIT